MSFVQQMMNHWSPRPLKFNPQPANKCLLVLISLSTILLKRANYNMREFISFLIIRTNAVWVERVITFFGCPFSSHFIQFQFFNNKPISIFPLMHVLVCKISIYQWVFGQPFVLVQSKVIVHIVLVHSSHHTKSTQSLM